MRRRQSYRVAPEPAPPLPPYEPRSWTGFVDRTEKGICKKCGRYIGKGVGLHKKWCKG